MSDPLPGIRERLAKSTPGPWFAYFSERSYWTIQCVKGWLYRQCGVAETVSEAETAEGDAQFIAHAPTDITYLLSLVDQQRETIEATSRIVDRIHDDCRSGKHTLMTCGVLMEIVEELRSSLTPPAAE